MAHGTSRKTSSRAPLTPSSPSAGRIAATGAAAAGAEDKEEELPPADKPLVAQEDTNDATAQTHLQPLRQSTCCVSRQALIDAYESVLSDELRAAGPLPEMVCGLGLHPCGAGSLYSSSTPAVLNAPMHAVEWQAIHDGWIASVTMLSCGHAACATCVSSRGASVQCMCGVETTVPPDASTSTAPDDESLPEAALFTRLQRCVAHLPLHHAATQWSRKNIWAALRTAVRSPCGDGGNSEPLQMPPVVLSTPSQDNNSSAAAAGMLCGVCEETPQEVFCEECNFGLCASCRASVHSKGRFKRHTLSAARFKLTPSHHPGSSSSCCCPEHPTYPIELYCSSCSTCICLRCHYSGAHKGHTTSPLAELVNGVREELREQRESIANAGAVMQQTLAVLQRRATLIDDEVNNMLSALREQFNAARQLLEKAEEEAVRDLHSLFAQRHRALDEDVNETSLLALRLRAAALGIRVAMGGDDTVAPSTGAALLSSQAVFKRHYSMTIAGDPHVAAAVSGPQQYSSAIQAVCDGGAGSTERQLVSFFGRPSSAAVDAKATLPDAIADALAALHCRSNGRLVAATSDPSERLLVKALSQLKDAAVGRHKHSSDSGLGGDAPPLKRARPAAAAAAAGSPTSVFVVGTQDGTAAMRPDAVEALQQALTMQWGMTQGPTTGAVALGAPWRGVALSAALDTAKTHPPQHPTTIESPPKKAAIRGTTLNFGPPAAAGVRGKSKAPPPPAAAGSTFQLRI